jgi:hypothetical protein
VDARKLCSVIDNLFGMIELDNQGDHLKIKSSSADVLVAGIDTRDAPRPDSVNGVSVECNAHDLADLLGFGGNLARVGKGGGENAIQIVPAYGVVATDSFIGAGNGAKVVCHQANTDFAVFEDDRICIKSDYMKSALHALKSMGSEDNVTLTVCDSHISFKSDVFEICIRRLENGTVGKVPMSFLSAKREWDSEFVTGIEPLSHILGIMSAIAPPEKRSINVRGEGSVLKVTQGQTEFGTSEHSLDVMTSHDFDGEVFVDMDMLILALNSFGRQDSVVVKYSSHAMSVSMDGKEVIFAGTEDV